MRDTEDPLVVVIEDEPDVSEMLELVLEGAGWRVVTALTGAAGLAAVRETDPDLVTLDLTLPDLDGLDVCRQIREVSDCYVVMVTARVAEIDRMLGSGLGADDYVVKPFSPRELVARIEPMRRPRTTDPSAGGTPA